MRFYTYNKDYFQELGMWQDEYRTYAVATAQRKNDSTMLYLTNTTTLIIDSSDLMQQTSTYTYVEHPIWKYLLITEISNFGKVMRT